MAFPKTSQSRLEAPCGHCDPQPFRHHPGPPCGQESRGDEDYRLLKSRGGRMTPTHPFKRTEHPAGNCAPLPASPSSSVNPHLPYCWDALLLLVEGGLTHPPLNGPTVAAPSERGLRELSMDQWLQNPLEIAARARWCFQI